MFKHEKQFFHPVEVERPNPQYAALLQEQLGGANGELTPPATLGQEITLLSQEIYAQIYYPISPLSREQKWYMNIYIVKLKIKR